MARLHYFNEQSHTYLVRSTSTGPTWRVCECFMFSISVCYLFVFPVTDAAASSVVGWLAGSFSLTSGSDPSTPLWSQSVLVLSDLELTSSLGETLLIVSIFRRMLGGFFARWETSFILDSFHLQVSCYLLIKVFLLLLLVQTAEWIGLSTFLTCVCCVVHLLLGLFLQRVPFLFKCVSNFLIHWLKRGRGRSWNVEDVWTPVWNTVTQRPQASLN